MVKTKLKKSEECSALFEIEVTKEDIEKAFQEVYADIQKIANIPGFRVGKAPQELVRKHYAQDAKDEVLKRLISDAYQKAVKEHEITPVGYPEISDVNFEEGKPLVFKARVDSRPKIKVANYKGIKVEKKKAEPKDQDVDKTIENLREISAKYVDAEERPIQYGDYAVCNLDCSVDGKPIHKTRENLWIFVEKGSVVPGLHENIVGMKKGEEKDVEVTLPEQYPDTSVRGKKAVYHVNVKDLKTRVLPKVDDEFAKDLGKENLENLRKEIKEELDRRMKANLEVEAENQLLKKLIDAHVFKVPKNLFERQLKFMVEDAKERLKQKGFKEEDLNKKDNEFRDKFKDEAERQVRLFFILDEISKAEGVDVSAEDLEGAYESISTQTGKSKDEVKKHYEKEDLVGDLEERIRESKTIDFLMKQANVVEIE